MISFMKLCSRIRNIEVFATTRKNIKKSINKYTEEMREAHKHIWRYSTIIFVNLQFLYIKYIYKQSRSLSER